MLVKNLLSSFFVFILLFSCGGGGTSSPSDEENFTFQKFLNGLVVDGYIKNAEVWIETTNDFSSFGETKTISNQLGSFNLSTQETNFRIQTSGGIDLDTNNSLDNLVLVNHKINDFVSNSEQPFIVSPLTTADFFLSLSLAKLNNPVSVTINSLLGLDQNLNINIVDHVENINKGYKFSEAYEKANQLTILALSLTKLVNNLSGVEIKSNEIFQIILDEMVASYQISQSEVSIESSAILDSIIEKVNFTFSLSLQSETREKVSNMLEKFLPLIQVKPNLATTHALFDFATDNFFIDLIAVASGNDVQNIYSRYDSDLVAYVSEISGETVANLAFSIQANPDLINSFEDQSFNIDVLVNDDFDNQASFNISFTQPINGTITKNNSNILVYQPNTDFNGNDSFTYTLEQGSLNSSATVNISVAALPDAPIISSSSSNISIPENQLDVVTILASDADGDALSFLLSGPDASYFAISNTGQLVFQDFPDYEFRSSFSLTITVSDGSLSDSINLNIEILDISYVIDLLVYYAPDMLSFHGSESAVRTKVLYLITSANSALNRSKAEIQFNLLKLLPYDVDVANQSNDDIFSSLVEREKIKRDQVLYGADYFILLSRWDNAKIDQEGGAIGGTAYIDFNIDENDWDAAHGYLSAWSVDPNWNEIGCSPCFPDKVFAHELGHNLGSGHWPGANGQSYAYGHRVDGNSDGDFTDSLDWGTVMSYSDISPDYFSNPNVICKNNSACGVLNQSDNSKWYNSYGTRFSNILPASSLDNSNSSNKISIKNLFPKISGGISTFSNAGSIRNFTITEFSDVVINGLAYKSFKWENALNDIPKMAYHFYELNDKYYINRTDYEGGYKFSNQDEYTLYNNNDLCVFFDSFQSIGNYLSRECSNAHYGNPPTYNNVYHFNHFIKNENITVPYGNFDSIKYVFTIWDNNSSPYSTDAYLMHTVFWMNNEVGIVQYRDHLGRIWKLESADTDGDGIDNKLDNDDDNDGVLDIYDAFKLDPTSSVDSNQDGIPD